MDGRAFPTAAALNEVPESDLRLVCRMGYRASYLRMVSGTVAGQIDLEELRNPRMPDAAVLDLLRSIKGFGAYSRGLMMRLTRRYDEFAVDSWCRAKYRELHPRVKNIDEHIERNYRQWGKFAGLVFWLDITRNWYLPGTSWP